GALGGCHGRADEMGDRQDLRGGHRRQRVLRRSSALGDDRVLLHHGTDLAQWVVTEGPLAISKATTKFMRMGVSRRLWHHWVRYRWPIPPTRAQADPRDLRRLAGGATEAGEGQSHAGSLLRCGCRLFDQLCDLIGMGDVHAMTPGQLDRLGG